MKLIQMKFFLYFILLCTMVSSLSACAASKKSIHLSDVQNSISEIIEEHYLKPCPSGRISVYSYTIMNSEENSSFTDKLIVGVEILQQFYSPFLSDQNFELFNEEFSTVQFILSIQDNQIIKEEIPFLQDSSSWIDSLDALGISNNQSENYDNLNQECQDKAFDIIHSQKEAEKQIESIFETMISNPLLSSSPQDILSEYSSEWNQLIHLGYQTLDYCFQQFLKGNQTDLKGYLMMLACRSIIDEWYDIDVETQTFSTGQQWFDSYQILAEEKYKSYISSNYGYFKRWHPAAWHLIEVHNNMTNE